MGFIDVVNSFFNSLRDFASSDNEFTCSQCIKCSQCLKTLSNGTQIKVYACPLSDDTIFNNPDLDALLPSPENGFGIEYKEQFIKNHELILSYIEQNRYSYDKLPLYSGQITGDLGSSPVLNFTELKNCYQAMQCPYFRPYLKGDYFLDNEYIEIDSIPSLSNFYSLSEEDKLIITQKENY